MRKFKKFISAVTAGIMTLSLAASMSVPVSAVELSAVDLVEDMGLGWNLGNTLDSVVQWEDSPSVSTVETGWGNIITTEAMIQKIKASGFNTVRVPVTWSQGTDWSKDYTQNTEFMARVKEVVDYVIKNDMYCILNMHHDEDWIEKDTSETKAKYESDWKTIANTFKDYDQHLVFEGTNECEFANDATQMTYNQLFVDTVRASGGNNANRLCLVPANNNNLSKALSDNFSVPNDSAKMVAVSAHYYEPPQFCVADANASWGHLETWGTDSDVSTVANDFNKLKLKFVDKGVPVIIGEYGVVNADKYGVNSTNYNKDLDSIHKFVKTVASTAYNMKGICPVAWDDSNSGTILFFNRKELTFWDSEIEKIFKDVSENKVTDTTTFENVDRVTVDLSNLTPDSDGNYRIDLSPYAGQGAVVKSIILEGDVTGAGVGYGLGFEAYRDGATSTTWSSETIVLGSEGKATADFDGKSSYTDETTKKEVSYNYVMDMNYLQIQQWWTNSADSTAKLKSATLVFDKEISIASSSSQPSTEPVETTEAPTTEPVQPTNPPATEPPTTEPQNTNVKYADISKDKYGNLQVTLPAAADTVYLDVALPSGATYANGGLGAVVAVDGKYYWANLKWETKSSGEVAVNLSDAFLNASLDDEEVTDKATLDAIKEGLSGLTSLQLQVWYTDKGETSDVTIKDVYIKDSSIPAETTEPSTPTETITWGDVNGDNAVDIADVLSLNQYLLGLNVTIDSKSADVDKNGTVNDTDVLYILKSLVDLATLPVA